MANNGIPIFDPNGNVRMIPADQVSAALAAGGTRAVKMSDPKGTQRWVRDGDVEQAKAAGGKLIEEDTRNSFQKNFDAASADVTPEERKRIGPVAADAKQLIHTAGGTIGAPIAHPIQTAKGLWALAKEIGETVTTPDPDGAANIPGPIRDQMESIVHDFQTMPKDQATAKLVGLIGGMYAGGKATEGFTGRVLPKVAERALPVAADVADNAAAGVANRTIGALKKDFKRGANPGRGFVKAKIGPSTSLESIAEKAGDARATVADQLRSAYNKATGQGKRISADKVRAAVNSVIDDAKNSAQGPGVVADPEAYEALRKTFDDSLTDADGQKGFTPKELWDIRKNIDRNLNWGDQAKLNMTKVQQRISGAIGGLLKEAIPETVDLNQQYSDLTNLETRATDRAVTHSSPLTSLATKAGLTGGGVLLGHGSPEGMAAGAVGGAMLDSIPVKSTAAAGLGAIADAARSVDPETIKMPAAAGAAALGAVPSNSQPDHVGDSDKKDDLDQSSNNVEEHGDSPAPNATPAALPTVEEKNVVPASPERGVEPVNLPVVVPPKHPAGEITAFDEASGLPIVRRGEPSKAEPKQGEPPPEPQSSAEPTPESHVFDAQQWLQANPGGDHEAATEAAREAGYQVV